MLGMKGNVANVGPSSRHLRLWLGIVALGVGSALAGYLAGSGATRWWGILSFFLFGSGVMLVLEAASGVCVLLALRNQRNLTALMSVSGHRFEDPAVAAQVRRQALQITLQSLLVAAVATTVYLMATR